MLRSIAAVLFAALFAATPAFAADAFTPAQKSAMDSAIKQFILDNPQILISSVEAYYNKQNATKKAQEGPLTQFPAGLLDFPGNPYVGPKDAKVTVVEFFDYNCGYCKQVNADIERVINEEKNVRVVFKELPILSDTSELAARYALAANKQGKYLPYHQALLSHQGPITETFLLETAKSIGLDTDKLKKDADTQDVRDILNKNVELAKELGVRGTPFFVIGREKVPGAIGFTKIKELIDQESGVKPTAAAPVEAPTPAAAPAPKAEAPAAPAAPVAAATAEVKAEAPASPEDAAANAEIEKAKAEARAMIDEIKAQAAKMQAEAIAAEKANPKK